MTKKPENKTVWTKQLAVKSVFCFLGNLIFTLLLVFGILIWTKGGDFAKTFSDNIANYIYILLCDILLVFIMYFYFFFENRAILADTGKTTLVFAVMDVSVVVSFLFSNYIGIYARPVALAALLMLMLVGRKEAIFMNVVTAVLMFLIDNFSDTAKSDANIYSSFVLTFVAGMLAIFFGNMAKTRFQVVRIGLIIVIPLELIIFILECAKLAGGGEELMSGTITEASFYGVLTEMGYGLLGALSSAVLFLALLPMFELLFNCLTPFRLREMCSSDAKLLKKLKEEAPGTYNHSVVVAQLAEACAEAIGEDPDYARAAAFYHDVGKLHQPEYFTENQGEYNLHDELTPELSADIIRSHTLDGHDLIKTHHLPQFLSDVALEHHGTMPIRYFYAKALKMTDGELNVEDFSYAGPKPATKIAAIIMIADASEAVARALQSKSPEDVERAISGIIEERMDLEQFSDCNVTMADLTAIKDVLVNTLSGVYHHRVKYPSIRYKRSGGKTTGENE
jgi:putative nucleotidyltransferase with HDIG domain